MKLTKNILIKDISWVKIGGQCEEFIEIDNTEELIEFSRNSFKENKKFEIIGWSCNTLFSDEGIKVPLVKLKTNKLELGINKNTLPESRTSSVDARHITFKNKNITSGFDTDDLEYNEIEGAEVIVKVDAGYALSNLINILNDQGIVGLHFFAGIPSSVGAAAINNIHGGPKSFSDYVYAVEVIDENGELKIMTNQEMQFDYDYSILQHKNSVVTSVYFLLRHGDKEKAKRSSVEWARRKSTQPKNSLGSAFHNLDRQTQERLGLPTTGIAYLIEHELNLSGFRVGNIMIPEQTAPGEIQVNKNIIINLGNGSAEDYLAVLNKVWDEAYEKFGIKLKTEIHFKGFDEERIRKFFG